LDPVCYIVYEMQMFQAQTQNSLDDPHEIEDCAHSPSFYYVTQTIWNKLCAISCASVLSFEVSDGEHPTVWQANALDGDEFPSFIAQGVQVLLNIVYDRPAVGLEMV
jgi:hypothetical protein